MKDYSKIEKNKYGKYYLNENNKLHRLTGPAIEYKTYWNYWINGIWFLDFNKNPSKLWICIGILELIPEYEIYVKQNIEYLIQEYNPEIIFRRFAKEDKPCSFTKEQINQFPNWFKDLERSSATIIL